MTSSFLALECVAGLELPHDCVSIRFPPSVPKNPTKVCRLHAGILWLELLEEGRPITTDWLVGSAWFAIDKRDWMDVGRLRREIWLVEDRLQGTNPVLDVRRDE